MLPAFVLVLFRVSALTLAVPLFSGTGIPLQIKVILSVAISLAVFPLAAQHLPTSVTLGSAVIGLAGEIMVGLFLGLGVTLVFVGVQLGSHLVGQQSGMAIGAVFNPMVDESITVMDQIYYFVMIMVFLGLGGDHALIRSLLDSFETVPPLAFRPGWSIAELMMDLTALSFTLAIRVAGPTILALLTAFLVLGFLSRTIPQLNILTVGFPFKLAVGLVVMAMTITFMEPVIEETFVKTFDLLRIGLGLDPVG